MTIFSSWLSGGIAAIYYQSASTIFSLSEGVKEWPNPVVWEI
jgi:hypothetical protein